ncbi:MAG: SEL1-like repeat protein [Elusimicrobia bacterium]|nr:SEL1-like repeat protein [Elusimicrobiota bacterium]
MKRLGLCACLLFAATLCPAAKPGPEDPGRIDGWVYRHDYFGLIWNLPEEASIQGRGWTRKALKEAVSVLGVGPMAAVLEEGLSKASAMLTLTLDQTSKDLDDSAIVMAAAERIPEAFNIRTGQAYIENTFQMMKASGAPIETRGPSHTRTLGGLAFEGQQYAFMDKELPGGSMISVLLAAIRGNHVFLFSIACGRQEGLARAQAVLDQAKFSGKGWLTSKEPPLLCEGDGCKEPSDPGDADPDVAQAFKHQHGKDAALDPALAAKLYRKAAQAGNSSAQARLGDMHLSGSGVAKDEGEGARWFAKAGKSGLAWAQATYADLLRDGRGVRRNDREAVRWYRKAASHGHSGAMYNLAAMRNEGRGVAVSGFEALGWLRAAAIYGDLDAMNDLAMMHLDGAGVPKSAPAAVQLLSAAAEKGHSGAQFNLARLYYAGEGVTKDAKTSFTWFQKAADQGHISAQEMLSIMYSQGHGVETDPAKSLEWTRKAAEGGSWMSQSTLARAYVDGEGVAKDLVEAHAWYSLAAEQDSKHASKQLQELSSQLTPEQLAEAKERAGLYRSKGK